MATHRALSMCGAGSGVAMLVRDRGWPQALRRAGFAVDVGAVTDLAALFESIPAYTLAGVANAFGGPGGSIGPDLATIRGCRGASSRVDVVVRVVVEIFLADRFDDVRANLPVELLHRLRVFVLRADHDRVDTLRDSVVILDRNLSTNFGIGDSYCCLATDVAFLRAVAIVLIRSTPLTSSTNLRFAVHTSHFFVDCDKPVT